MIEVSQFLDLLYILLIIYASFSHQMQPFGVVPVIQDGDYTLFGNFQ